MNFKTLKDNLSSFLFKCKSVLTKNHIIYDNKTNKWIFVSYNIKPFKVKKDDVFFHGHQNRQETLLIAEVIKELGLSYVFNDYNKPLNFKKKKFDIVFGLEPNFEKLCNRNPKAIKIYYATGAYYEHQNSMIIKRTDAFCKKYSISYPYKRLVNKHNSCEIADFIFQIGSQFTIETYPQYLRHKINKINQTSHVFKDVDIEKKLRTFSKKDYIWFGSGGTILKGLDIVIDYFISNPEINLHVVGPVEKEFLSVFSTKIKEAKNIFLYGFLDVDTKLFRDLADKCAFLIFPSASEGGSPGSVINLQKLGVIPIVSVWASPDSISELGLQLRDLDAQSMKEAIDRSQQIPHEEVIRLIKLNHHYVRTTHYNARFKNDFKIILNDVITNARSH